ncbi:hypothetical protein DENSPDRAFT_581515 [Dentipellis sp. KUC8613]|nr:hypothetical protein DENSPDRAFT_581515 [Dentipellis sp. KUC8613]
MLTECMYVRACVWDQNACSSRRASEARQANVTVFCVIVRAEPLFQTRAQMRVQANKMQLVLHTDHLSFSLFLPEQGGSRVEAARTDSASLPSAAVLPARSPFSIATTCPGGQVEDLAEPQVLSREPRRGQLRRAGGRRAEEESAGCGNGRFAVQPCDLALLPTRSFARCSWHTTARMRPSAVFWAPAPRVILLNLLRRCPRFAGKLGRSRSRRRPSSSLNATVRSGGGALPARHPAHHPSIATIYQSQHQYPRPRHCLPWQR